MIVALDDSNCRIYEDKRGAFLRTLPQLPQDESEPFLYCRSIEPSLSPDLSRNTYIPFKKAQSIINNISTAFFSIVDPGV